MNKIDWCLKQKKGIELVEPNDNLCDAYFHDADNSLLTMDKIDGTWQIVTAYYACYNSLYALLMKAGLKCEIHDCTLELMSFFDFTSKQKIFLKNLKKLRIAVQYYLEPAVQINKVEVKLFVTCCKNLAKNLNSDEITKIRGLVKNG